jgi:hypothetical protein
MMDEQQEEERMLSEIEEDDDSDLIDEDPGENVHMRRIHRDPPRSRRGRKKRKPGVGGGVNNGPGDGPAIENSVCMVTKKELIELDLDEWSEAWRWETPRMSCQISRIAPPYFNNVPVAGFLEKKLGSGYKYEEIVSRFGGGCYELGVSGPLALDRLDVKQLAKKRITIPGDPNLESLPTGAIDAMQKQGGMRRMNQGSSNTDGKLIDIVQEELHTLRDQVYNREKTSGGSGSMDLMKEVFETTARQTEKAMEERAKAKEMAAQTQANFALEMLKLERERAEREREEMKRVEHDLKREMDERIKTPDNSMFMSLLPQFSQSADQRVESVMRTYEAREERLMASHQNSINDLNRMHTTQLDAQRMMFETQIRSMQVEKEMLLRQLEDSRREVDRTKNELMTQVSNAKPKTFPEQMMEYQMITDAIKGMVPSPPGEGSIADDIEQPWLRSIMKLAEKGMTIAPGVIEAMQQRKAMAQQPQMIPQPQPMAMVPQQPRPQVQPPRIKIDRKQLQMAAEFINGVLTSKLSGQSAPTPDEIASAAVQMVDNQVLRELARRDPEKVIDELIRAGIFTGPSTTPEGKEYIKQLLEILPSKLP